MTAALIVGLGSPHGDDQAGWQVVQRLHRRGIPEEYAVVARTPADLWNWCPCAGPLIVCDACVGWGEPGSIGQWRWPGDVLPGPHGGTHDLSLGEVLALGRELGWLPDNVEVWTITGSSFESNGEPCSSVVAAAERLANRLAGDRPDA